MSFSDVALPMFDEIVEEIGDSAAISDGVTSIPVLAGFFNLAFTPEQSDRYGITLDAPTFECRADAVSGLARAKLGAGMTLTVNGRTWQVADLRNDAAGLALLVLSR